jgi:hypothetical protein
MFSRIISCVGGFQFCLTKNELQFEVSPNLSTFHLRLKLTIELILIYLQNTDVIQI